MSLRAIDPGSAPAMPVAPFDPVLHIEHKLQGLTFDALSKQALGESLEEVKSLIATCLNFTPEPDLTPDSLSDQPHHPNFIGIVEFGLTRKVAVSAVVKDNELAGFKIVVDFQFTNERCKAKDSIALNACKRTAEGVEEAVGIPVEVIPNILPHGTWNDQAASPRSLQVYEGNGRPVLVTLRMKK